MLQEKCNNQSQTAGLNDLCILKTAKAIRFSTLETI